MKSKIKRSTCLCRVIVIIVGVLLLPTPAYAATYTVNTTDDLDDGACTAEHCSLREAINEANANPGPDTILFGFPGAGPHLLSIAGNLPVLVDDETTIDGTVLPGYSYSPLIHIASPQGDAGLIIRSANNIIRGLSITRFTTYGIMIDDPAATGNLVEENYIGLVPNGVGVDGSEIGIYISRGANNIIQGNVVSGNETGLWVATSNNQILNNKVGTTADGSNAAGNSGVGVTIVDAFIGTTSGNMILDNLISGNGGAGIALNAGTQTTVIQGNLTGLDAGGAFAIPNQTGISLYNSQTNLIGGSGTNEGNTISGNLGNGIEIVGSSDSNQFINNLIGTNNLGALPLGNGGHGVHIDFGPQDIIISQNLISGNHGDGICTDLGTSNITITGNLIGTDIQGVLPIPNEGNGIKAANDATNITIGGPSAGDGNLISGNTQNGIYLMPFVSQVEVEGNKIGTTLDGTVGLGNGDGGILIAGTNVNVTDNLVSGNEDGVINYGDTVVIQGNLVGTNIDGSAIIGNTYGGIVSNAPNTIIGGTNPTESNLVSGNFIGIDVISRDTLIQGNKVGTNLDGTTALGNAIGIRVQRGDPSFGATVGGLSSGAGNLVSGNTNDGILAFGPDGTWALIEISGNLVGTDLNGTGSLGNGAAGIHSTGNDILINQNTIAYNGGPGVWVTPNDTLRNTISQNSTFQNGGIGIDLDWQPGPNPNGGPGGPNMSMEYPEFTSVTTTLVEGTACVDCIVELFLTDDDPTGYGEGRNFLVSGIASGGNFSIPIPPGQLDLCKTITATATDSSGNTSEFSVNIHSTGVFCLVKDVIFNTGIVLIVGIIFGLGGYVVRKRVPWGVGGFFVGVVLGGGILVIVNILARGPIGVVSPEPDGYPPMEYIVHTPQIPSDESFPAEFQDAEDVPPQPTVTSSTLPSPTSTPTPTPTPTPVPTKAPPTATEPPLPKDTNGPKVSGASASPNPALTTSPVTISATISDSSGVASAIVYYKSGKGGYQSAGNMKSGGGNIYFLNIGTLTPAGTYTFRILAEDKLGNANCSVGNLDACPGGTFVVNIP
jgi:CSLREA domain-containing protein